MLRPQKSQLSKQGACSGRDRLVLYGAGIHSQVPRLPALSPGGQEEENRACAPCPWDWPDSSREGGVWQESNPPFIMQREVFIYVSAGSISPRHSLQETESKVCFQTPTLSLMLGKGRTPNSLRAGERMEAVTPTRPWNLTPSPQARGCAGRADPCLHQGCTQEDVRPLPKREVAG